MTTGSVHVPAPGAPAARYSAAQLAALLEQPPPTAEQTSVIEAPLAPMLVVAGAGSGKTETMASRVVWLIANGIAPAYQDPAPLKAFIATEIDKWAKLVKEAGIEPQ